MSAHDKSDLRNRAEQVIQTKYPNLNSYSPVEFETVVHELQVHQIELELQNEELRRTQAELEISRQQYTNLFEHAPVGYVILNEDKQIIQVNATAVEMFSSSRRRLLNSFFFKLVAEADQEIFLLFFNRLITTELSQQFEVQIVKADKTICVVQLECTKIEDATPSPYRIALIDITDRKRAEKQAFDLALEKENVRAFSEFLANAAHDIGTPLTILQTTLYLLAKTSLATEQQQRVSTVQQQVTQLIAIIDNMFQMSALDTTHEYHFKQIDVVIFIKSVIQHFAPLADEKQQILTLTHDPTFILATIDDFLVRRIVSNIINNAIIYSSNGATISLDVYTQDETLVIAVKDNGPGISPEDLPHIFERFYRSDKARRITTGGSGLGLSIVKKIVEAHQGQVEVESELGKGSTFKVILPLI